MRAIAASRTTATGATLSAPIHRMSQPPFSARSPNVHHLYTEAPPGATGLMVESCDRDDGSVGWLAAEGSAEWERVARAGGPNRPKPARRTVPARSRAMTNKVLTLDMTNLVADGTQRQAAQTDGPHACR